MAVRVPPHNIEAEESVLGGLMLAPDSFASVSEHVTANDFYKVAHRKVFVAIQYLYNKGQPVDFVTVSNYLTDKKEIDSIGGNTFLAELMDKVPSAVNIDSYAQIVREKALLRKMIEVSTEVMELAYNQNYENVEGFLEDTESKIFSITESRPGNQSGLTGSAELIKLSIDKLTHLSTQTETITGVPTGFSELDEMTTGLQPGDLVIVAARPSMGKTAFSLNMAQHAAIRSGKTVAFFSIEMSKEQLMMRMLASEARINLGNIKVGRLTQHEWERLIDKASLISQANLFIDDTSGISPYEIRSKCRRLKAQRGLDLIMVDYLQIMDLKQKVESRERAVAEISKALKRIGKELGVPVVALAQLNRGVEGRSGDQRKPVLSDLRESGSIEQDADLIMMLYREEYYEQDNPDVKGMAEVLIRKHRNGPVGEIKLKWEGQFGKFSHWEGPPQHPLAADIAAPAPLQNRPRNRAPRAEA